MNATDTYLCLTGLRKTNKIPKLFFGIVTIEQSFKRRYAMYNIWIKKILELGHDYIYCTTKKIEPKFKWMPYKQFANSNYQNIIDSNFERENKRVAMAEYFLKTDADFFINPTDDVFVDSLRINKLAIMLGKKYNTHRDSIILGDCQYISRPNLTYLQGGVGYIMTRKMARQFVQLGNQWIKVASGPDDFEIVKFMKFLNKNVIDSSFPYMSGHGFIQFKQRFFNPKKLPICPDNYYTPECKKGVLKFEKIYMIHWWRMNLRQSLSAWKKFQYLLKDKHHHYGCFDKFPKTIICKFLY